MWNDEKMVAFDFETSGTLPEYALQPWRVNQKKSWATSLVYVRKTAAGMDVRGGLNPTVDTMREMLNDAIENDYTLVGWNTVFDISWLIAYGLGDLVARVKWLDGMLLWRHAFIEPEYDLDRSKKKSYSLKTCVAEVLPEFAGYEEDIDFHDTNAEAREALHEYNKRDTLFTLRLARHWYKKLAKTPRRLNAAIIESACLPLVAEANLKGMRVDPHEAENLKTYLDNLAAKKLAELAEHGVTEKIVRSPVQLSKLIYDDWKLPVLKENVSKLTGKTSRSTDKEVLYELAFEDKRAADLKTYREALNNRKKFAETPLDAAQYNEDNCAHPLAIVFGTYSGRLTYASKQGKNKDARQIGFALHQMKRGKEFRSIIKAPEGYTLVEFDASGQEFRWMAIASDDPTMLRLCLPGQDPHSFMGARIAVHDYDKLVEAVKSGDKQAKEYRQLGKVANLSLQYRTSARKLRTVARVQYGLPMEMPEAERIHYTYRVTYKNVTKYWERQIRRAMELGFVETFAGRRVQIIGDWSSGKGWSMGSTAINYRIQGTGADQKYLALAVLRPYLTEIGGYFAWDLHDGIYFYIPDNKVLKAVEHIHKTLSNLPYREAWGFDPPIPLPWDCKIGKSWGTLGDYNAG